VHDSAVSKANDPNDSALVAKLRLPAGQHDLEHIAAGKTTAKRLTLALLV